MNHTNHCQANSDPTKNTNFKNSHQTFGPSEYCKACPVYGVNCNNRMRKCESIDAKTYNSKKVISAKNKNDTSTTKIDVLMSGLKSVDINTKLKEICNNTGLFENASVQKWECRYLNKRDQCKLTNFADNIDDDQDIVFNEFFQRWLRYFVNDYNKLKDKISPCINNKHEKSNKCIKGCKKYCACVEQWLKIKENEWKNVKDHYHKCSKSDDDTILYRIKSYLKLEPFDTNYKKAQEVVEEENKRDELWGCTGRDECYTDETQGDKDFIINLINKLQKKIESCETQHGEPQSNCDDSLNPPR